jgi:hypothetical protein
MTDLMVFDFSVEFRVDEHCGIASVVCLHVALSGLYQRAVIHSFIHSCMQKGPQQNFTRFAQVSFEYS